MEPKWCPVIQPTKDDFARPFTEFVSEIFRNNPDMPCFKVVPPEGWKARQGPFPDMSTVRINTPIRQHAFGKAGAYRCLLVEHKPVSVAEYRQLAEEEAAKVTGQKGQSGSACAVGVAPQGSGAQARADADATLHMKDDLSERSFWASVTLNPPLYGADTPVSFFDEKLPYGWNLRNLGDLLRTNNVPEVPGVTTPMTYFGMWRAFFGWHKEDADLLSINYLHFGAPKVWYCVAPKHKEKFERMAASLFPQQAQTCAAFIRHKDILISPSQLRTYDIPYMQAKQQPGEFMVLNSASYHAGFNMGFNCAEAINFATEDWIAVGKAANRCTCSALKDSVRISMSLFDPSWHSPSPSDDDDDEDEDDSNASEHTIQQQQQRKEARFQALMRHTSGAARTNSDPVRPARPSPRTLDTTPTSGDADPQGADGKPIVKLSPAAQQLLAAYGRLKGGLKRRLEASEGGAGGSQGKAEEEEQAPAGGAAAGPSQPAIRGGQAVEVVDLISSSDDADDDGGNGKGGKGAKGSYQGRKLPPAQLERAGSAPIPAGAPAFRGLPGSRPSNTRQRRSGPAAAGPSSQTPPLPPAQQLTNNHNGGGPSVPPSGNPLSHAMDGLQGGSSNPPQAGGASSSRLRAGARAVAAPPDPMVLELQRDPVQGPPCAIVWEDEAAERQFHLVMQLQREAPSGGEHVLLRLLREGPDRLYHPCSEIWEELNTTLVEVRTQIVPALGGGVPAWKLNSRPEDILGTTLWGPKDRGSRQQALC